MGDIINTIIAAIYAFILWGMVKHQRVIELSEIFDFYGRFELTIVYEDLFGNSYGLTICQSDTSIV